ncbi:NAD(P)-binding protein [Chloroflexota bacterium]
MADNDKIGAVIVVGGGIGGIQASLDLAESGYKVYLVEESPAIGGKMAQLDKTFPTNDCSMCTLSPKLVECGRHPNIELLTYSDLVDIQGEPGDFRAKVLKRSRFIDFEKCTGCGECVDVCPVKIESEFDEGVGLRKATYRPYAQAFPNVFTIDKRDRSPCTLTCPAGINAHGYVALTSMGKTEEAYRLIQEELPFPGIIGRICPHPCESECRRAQVDKPVAICDLKWYVADKIDAVPVPEKKADKGKKAAIIGSGPAGLTAAYYLALEGYQPTIFEALPVIGGMLSVGIPEYRLPRDIIKKETELLQQLGVEFKVNARLGQDFGLDDLAKQGYEAVFVAVGAHKSQKLGIPGEDAGGVVQGVDFLRDLNLGKKPAVGKKVAIVGGGNVAIDAARSALRLGAGQITILYRRSRAEMPASDEEVEAAIDEGVQIEYLTAPVEVVAQKGKVVGVKCQRMELGEPDASGRRRPVPIPGSEFVVETDMLIPAIGQASDLSFLEGSDINVGPKSTVEVNPLTLATSRPGVFAGGDCQSGPGIAIEAVAAGKRAAESIRRYFEGEDMEEGRTLEKQKPENLRDISDEEEEKPREEMADSNLKKRKVSFDEVRSGFTEEQALREASRCLNCGGCSVCLQCVAACKADAIDHCQQDELVELRAGSVILSPGYDVFDARLKGEFGYGRYKNVVSSLEFERILSASGPFEGKVLRPGDRKHPKKIAWVQCVGSRDTDVGNGYCSSVCCMYAVKEAAIAREHQPDLDLTIFYNDIRAFGKGFEVYYENTKKSGVRFVKSLISGVKELQQSQNLLLSYRDNGEVQEEEFDMVVLSVGLCIPPKLRELAAKVGVELDRYGFCQTDEFSPTRTSRPGVFVCGAFEGPKDIPETVMQASGAAAQASAILAPVRGTLVTGKEYPPERDVAGEPPRIGVFVCHCGINIGGIVNVPEVVEYARTLPNVILAEENLYTCSQDTQERMKDKIKELGINRVVVASCTPRTHEPLFQETIKGAGLNRYLFSMANIRDQCSWVHREEKEDATEKSKDLVRSAVARSRISAELSQVAMSVVPTALVVGGGIAGMQAALGLAQQGFGVYLVEKNEKLGGLAWRVHLTWQGSDVQAYLKGLIEKVSAHPLISVYTGAEVVEASGHIGNFSTKIKPGSGETVEIKHGVVIIATGGQEYQPTEYLYGKDPRVMTLLELEDKVLNSTEEVLEAENLVMIQCVGSREEARNYCSRVCCTQAVTTALKLKELKPQMNIYILYRDIRTYGLREDIYHEAREKGITFIRYEPEDKPQVESGDKLAVLVTESSLGEKVLLKADILALAAAVLPNSENKEISQLFKVSRDENDFFLEAHVKLRPVDFAGEGLFFCGLAHGPKSIDESISQAEAAVSRACTVLSKESIQVGGVVSSVDILKCNGCGLCETVCPFGAINMEYNERLKRNVAVVTEASCKGCGLCAATCRSVTVDLKGFSDSEILEMIDALQAAE